MNVAGLDYAAWYQDGPFRPYVRSAFFWGDAVAAFEAAQPPGDLSDPPVSNLVVVQTRSRGQIGRLDLGAGQVEPASYDIDDVVVAARNSATDIVMPEAHVIRMFELSSALLGPVLTSLRSNGDPFDFGSLHVRPTRDRAVVHLLEALWSEGQGGDAIGRIFAEGVVVALGAALIREQARPVQRSNATWGPADWRVRRAIEYCEERLSEDIGLADIASAVDLSTTHIAALFRSALGMAPHRWIVQRRVDRACRLLEYDGGSMTDIAFACGFASSQHFARTFRRAMGMTPSAYRRERLR